MNKKISQRDSLAGQIKAILDDAAFEGTPINVTQANNLITQGQSLISKVTACATGGPC